MSQDPFIFIVSREASFIAAAFIAKSSLQCIAMTELFKDTRYPLTNAFFIALVECPLFPPRESNHVINSLVLHDKSILTCLRPWDFYSLYYAKKIWHLHLVCYSQSLCSSFSQPSQQCLITVARYPWYNGKPQIIDEYPSIMSNCWCQILLYLN